MLKIRLKRVGRKNNPSFRVVVVDSRQGPRSGRPVEEVGFYNPITKEKNINPERVKHWLDHGAQPSDTVYNMFVGEKIIEGRKKNVLPRKSPVVKEEKTKESEVPTSSDPSIDSGQGGESVGKEEKNAEIPPPGGEENAGGKPAEEEKKAEEDNKADEKQGEK